MAMTIVWCTMVILSLLFGALTGNLSAVSSAAMDGAGSAITLCLSIAGIICLWTGVMEVMKACGIAKGLATLFAPLLKRLMPQASKDEETMAAITGNFSANFLGLGNAATPLGIQAARRMARGCNGIASHELCLLVVMNTASIQIFPATITAIRTASGATDPMDILPAVWITSLCSVIAGLIAASLFARLSQKGR
ncbi:nucleoside recognition domain-containing protein [Bengtsoniella intestinalis]|uniref:nucleoside recognition domain-containing protein n=1 Tax=Bengtsoniella intestinalis TaxID=3073143 RepID=UPI00391F2869